MVQSPSIRAAKEARLETLRAHRRSLRNKICDYETWEAFSAAWPLLHVRLGLQTIPVLKEPVWSNFNDVLDGVETVASRFRSRSKVNRPMFSEPSIGDRAKGFYFQQERFCGKPPVR